MNNLLERTARAIYEAGLVKRNSWEWETQSNGVKKNRLAKAKAAITAICDEIDEGGIEKASNEIDRDDDYNTIARYVIQSYLNHLKSTTEIKDKNDV